MARIISRIFSRKQLYDTCFYCGEYGPLDVSCDTCHILARLQLWCER